MAKSRHFLEIIYTKHRSGGNRAEKNNRDELQSCVAMCTKEFIILYQENNTDRIFCWSFFHDGDETFLFHNKGIKDMLNYKFKIIESMLYFHLKNHRYIVCFHVFSSGWNSSLWSASSSIANLCQYSPIKSQVIKNFSPTLRLIKIIRAESKTRYSSCPSEVPLWSPSNKPVISFIYRSAASLSGGKHLAKINATSI